MMAPVISVTAVSYMSWQHPALSLMDPPKETRGSSLLVLLNTSTYISVNWRGKI